MKARSLLQILKNSLEVYSSVDDQPDISASEISGVAENAALTVYVNVEGKFRPIVVRVMQDALIDDIPLQREVGLHEVTSLLS